jgi:hypothetical protein
MIANDLNVASLTMVILLFLVSWPLSIGMILNNNGTTTISMILIMAYYAWVIGLNLASYKSIERANNGMDSYTYGYNLAIAVLITLLIIAFIMLLLVVMIRAGECIISCDWGIVVMVAIIAYHIMVLGMHILMVKRIDSIKKANDSNRVGVAYQTIVRA